MFCIFIKINSALTITYHFIYATTGVATMTTSSWVFLFFFSFFYSMGKVLYNVLSTVQKLNLPYGLWINQFKKIIFFQKHSWNLRGLGMKCGYFLSWTFLLDLMFSSRISIHLVLTIVSFTWAYYREPEEDKQLHWVMLSCYFLQSWRVCSMFS